MNHIRTPFERQTEPLEAAAVTYTVEVLVTDHEDGVAHFWEEWGQYHRPDEAVSALQYLRAKGSQARWFREAA